MAFPVETIPGPDRLLHHVAEPMFIRAEGRPSSACFKKRPKLSVNWEKYSSVQHTRREKSYAVICLNAGFCRYELQQRVIHSPIQDDEPFGPNRAHSDIEGEKPQRIADQMARAAIVAWIHEGDR